MGYQGYLGYLGDGRAIAAIWAMNGYDTTADADPTDLSAVPKTSLKRHGLLLLRASSMSLTESEGS